MASEDDKYRNKTNAKIDDLKYYFGDEAAEWIDFKLIKYGEGIARARNSTPSYSPSFCPICNKYWSYGLHSTTRIKYVDYLNWERIPCLDRICDNC